MNTTVRLAVSAWLLYLAVADVRRGEVSNWATVPPLLAVTAWRVAGGDWALGVTLVVVLVAAEWPVLWPLSVAGALASTPWAVSQGVEAAVAVWIGVVALWSLGVLGGADAKAVMALAALFPGERLAWLLLSAWFGISLFYLARRYGRAAPREVLVTACSLARLRIPQSGERGPALPAVALAGLVYAWFYFR